MIGAAALLYLVLTPAPAARAEPAVTIGLTFAPRRGTLQYHFDNRSAFDASGLVPHYFEQHYDTGGPWFGLHAAYAFRVLQGRTELAIAPVRTARGADFDTFFLPSGDIATTGTDGDVSLRALAFSQMFRLAGSSTASIGMIVTIDRSRAEFAPAFRVVTHSQPASETRTFITDRETTTSTSLGVGVTGSRQWTPGGRVQMRVEGALLPTIRARLLTQLPDKYPGIDIIFVARAYGMRGRLEVARPVGPVSVVLTTEGAFTRGYQRTADYRQRYLSVGVGVRLDR
jgi:hypothetical protein